MKNNKINRFSLYLLVLCLSSCAKNNPDWNSINIIDADIACSRVINKFNDSENALSNEYLTDVYSKLHSNWALPEELYQNNDLKSVVVVTINQNGSIKDYYYEKKSSNLAFNNLVELALKKTKPFPRNVKLETNECIEIGLVFLSKKNNLITNQLTQTPSTSVLWF